MQGDRGKEDRQKQFHLFFLRKVVKVSVQNGAECFRERFHRQIAGNCTDFGLERDQARTGAQVFNLPFPVDPPAPRQFMRIAVTVVVMDMRCDDLRFHLLKGIRRFHKPLPPCIIDFIKIFRAFLAGKRRHQAGMAGIEAASDMRGVEF